jgi:hypothetical protein
MAMIKQYIRTPAERYSKDKYGNVYHLQGRPRRIGVIVSTGPGKFGYSLVSDEDQKKMKSFQTKVGVINYTQNGEEKMKAIRVRVPDYTGKQFWEMKTTHALENENIDEGIVKLPKFVSKQIKKFQKRSERFFK